MQIATIIDPNNRPDQVAILGYRELLQYNTNLGDWNEVHVTFITNLLTPELTGGNFNETGVDATNNSRVMFGLKYEDNLFPDDPLTASICSPRSNIIRDEFGTTIRTWTHNISAIGGLVQPQTFNFADTNNSRIFFSRTNVSGTIDARGTTFRYRVINKGTGTQAIEYKGYNSVNTPTFTGGYLTPSDIAAYRATNHTTALVGPTNTLWLTPGGDPAPLPTSFFFYWPFVSCRLCIHGILIEKVN